MSVYANAGRILITDASGLVKLDTNDAMLHIVPPALAGTINIPLVRLTGSDADINDTQYWDIGPCHLACTDVIGAVRLSSSAPAAIGFNRWTSYPGGDLVWAFGAPSGAFRGAQSFISYRFYASGGRVWMAQRRWLLAGIGTTWVDYLAHSIEFRLKAGLYS